MSPSVSVIFNEPRAVYFPGQTITGKVIVSLTSSQNCRGVKVIFQGFSHVHWEEERRKYNIDVTHHFCSTEEYYHMKFYVWGNGSSSSLPAGQHAFDFRFILPHSIPSSFQSDIGYVRHTCTAQLDLPFVCDKKCCVPFSVNCISDLNLIPSAENPIHATKSKNLCCLCCKSGPISFVLNIAKSGFVCGEKILIDAECTNMTDSVLKKSVAELLQTITYYAESSEKKVTRVVSSVEHPEIPPGDSDIWSAVQLSIPALPPSDLQGCNNIKIEYQFQFRIDPRILSFDLKKTVPIIIGTIPLRRYHHQIVASPEKSPAPVLPPGYTGLEAPPDYPPPYVGHPSAPETQPGYPAPQPGYPAPQPGYPAPQPGYPAPQPGCPPYPEASAPPAVAMGFPGAQLYPDMPAPSFSECYFGPMQYKEGDGNDGVLGPNFAPSYVTYGFS